jgi:hypothetical protein
MKNIERKTKRENTRKIEKERQIKIVQVRRKKTKTEEKIQKRINDNTESLDEQKYKKKNGKETAN